MARAHARNAELQLDAVVFAAWGTRWLLWRAAPGSWGLALYSGQGRPSLGRQWDRAAVLSSLRPLLKAGLALAVLDVRVLVYRRGSRQWELSKERGRWHVCEWKPPHRPRRSADGTTIKAFYRDALGQLQASASARTLRYQAPHELAKMKTARRFGLARSYVHDVIYR